MEGKATMNLNEFAQRMGISISLAYKLAANGQIPVIRLGQRRVVVPAWVAEKMLGDGWKNTASS